MPGGTSAGHRTRPTAGRGRGAVLVPVRRDVRVLERLVLHHVAPVARRVADRNQDRPVLVARTTQRFVPPGVPVNRVVLVLEEVGRGLGGEAVRHSFEATRVL